MKKPLIILLMLIATGSFAWAGYLTNFKIYYGYQTEIYSGGSVTIGNVTQYIFTAPSTSTFYFAVTAIDNLGVESDYSNEISAYVVSGQTVTLEWDRPTTYSDGSALFWWINTMTVGSGSAFTMGAGGTFVVQ